MCDQQLPGRPGTPEYRAAWLERRHRQMVERIAEMNHERNVAVARAERLERALRHIALRDELPIVTPEHADLVPPGWLRDMVRAAANALADVEKYDTGDRLSPARGAAAVPGFPAGAPVRITAYASGHEGEEARVEERPAEAGTMQEGMTFVRMSDGTHRWWPDTWLEAV